MSHATPIDMVKHLDQCRIGFLAKTTKFASVTEASKRLKAHYNKRKKQGKLKASALQPVGDLRHQLVVVRHEIPGRYKMSKMSLLLKSMIGKCRPLQAVV
ncbi:hypothetical protein GQ600_17106 [Phytophthora cactorum]|nr:hypothetical protein GQ600_17106 [Phytophthora cactorum]